VIGPLTRHVEDLLPALAVIAGVDWRDPSVMPVPLEAPVAGVSGRRIGWFVEMLGAEPEATTVAMVQEAAKLLGDAGASVEEVRLPRIEDAMPITEMYWRRMQSPSWNEWAPPGPSTLSADEIERSIFEWDRFRRAMTAFIEGFDAIVCPVAEGAAPAHGAIERRDYLYTVPFSLTGQPVAVVRAGTVDDGMPIGVQVVARPWHEGDAVAVASAIEADLGGWRSATR
jgi:amidase